MILHSPDSAHAKELAKWEQQPTPSVPQPVGWADGGRYPRRFEEYPKMLYRAGRPTAAGVYVTDSRVVATETEERLARGQGFHDGQQAAIDAVHQADQALATAAAERAYTDRRMSPNAQAEAAEVDATTADHVGDIPTRRRGPGRPKAGLI